MRPALWITVALVAAGCRSAEPPPEEVPARRSDVVAALYKQLDLVLARYETMEDDESESARRERVELLQMAREIRLRIVRFDPNADLSALVEEP